jgi:hypothetical protein
MSEWKNPDGSVSVGAYEDFVGFRPKGEETPAAATPEKKPVKKTSKKK